MEKRALTRGFTITEAMAVVAIVSVLAAVVVPLVCRARERARQSGCLNNLRAISAAVMNYTADHDETYPLPRMRYSEGCDPLMDHWTWKRAVLPYIQSTDVLRCPGVRNYWASCPDTPGASGDESNVRNDTLPASSQYAWMPASYSYSAGFLRGRIADGQFRPRVTSELEDPNATLLILNTRTGASTVGPWAMLESGYNPETGGKNRRFTYRYGVFVTHLRRIPCILADGHVETLALSDTVTPVDLWRCEDPHWDARTEIGRRNLQAAAQYAETNITEYRTRP